MEWLAGNAFRTGRVYADFVVDGRPLSEDARTRGDLISCLGWGARAGQDQTVAELLLETPAPLPGHRIPLYVCPEDGDLHCGAVTARVERHGDEVVWSDFGYETGLDIDPPELDQRGLGHLGPFRFAWRSHAAAIRSGYGADGFNPEGERPHTHWR